MAQGLTDERLAELYTRYGYLVRRRCLAVLGSAVDAEDAMQEVFVRVRKYGVPQPPPASLLAWLYTVANRCCYDALGRRGRQEPLDPAELPQVDQRTVGSLADADRRAVVGAVLRELDEATREMGLLHHLGGLTQEEVAEKTGYSRKTVGKKLQAFEAALKARLAGAGT